MEGEKTIYNFSAGPCILPKEVIRTCQEELLDFKGTGVSVMELSHRSAEVREMVAENEALIRSLLNVPKEYNVFQIQGGATMQFGAVPLNLLGDKKSANYLITGSWSKGAHKDGAKFCNAVQVLKEPLKKYVGCPPVSEWTWDKDAAYFHYCSNETIYGVEFFDFPYEELGDQILVSDKSSEFMSRPIDVSKYGVVYAGVQKNAGMAGIAITMVRDDLLGNPLDKCPLAMNWTALRDCTDPSGFPTPPPNYSMYVNGVFMKYMKDKGGIPVFEELSKRKSSLLYDYVDGSGGYYTNPVDVPMRSTVNVPFRIKCDEKYEAKFLKEAQAEGLIELKGHRTVGGCRASLYNGMPLEGVEALVSFMKKFKDENP